MQRTPVTSQQIKSIGYDPTTATLEVEFTNGAVYQYSAVPAHIHQELMEAESIGKYFNQHIKYGFRYERVDVQTEGDAA